MPLFHVRSGKMNTVVRAVNHKTAAIVATNKELKPLNTFVVVLKKGDPKSKEVVYTSTKILYDMECDAWSIEDQN